MNVLTAVVFKYEILCNADEGLKGWSGHSCLLTYLIPKPYNPLSGHVTTRCRLPHRKKEGAIYRITSRLAVAIPRDNRRVFQVARKPWVKRNYEYKVY